MTADPQQTLDTTGVLRLPAGTTTPAVPLFLDANATLTADDGATLDCYQAGTGFVVGWRRGLVSDAHWGPDGWRTLGDAFLFARGTEWDLGPQYPQATGWAGVRQIRVRFSGVLYRGGWAAVAGGATWYNTALCGMQSDEDGYTEGSPAPWQLYGNDRGGFTLAVRTGDGVVRRWDVAADQSRADVDLTVSADLTTGAATATLNGAAAVPSAARAGGGFGPALTLRPNSRFPFGITRLPPQCDDGGYRWAETLPDVLVREVAVSWNGSASPNCQFVGADARPQPTYAGGPSLPLAASRRGGRWLWAVAAGTQGKGSSGASNVRVSGLALSGRSANPAACVGVLYGGLNLVSDVRGGGGTRFLQSMGMMNYPLTVRDCDWKYASDRGVYLSRACGLSLDRVNVGYGNRAVGELWECAGVVRGATLYAPPGPPAQDAVWVQGGGQVSYECLNADYEYAVPAGTPFLALTPYSNDGFATGARLTDCSGGTLPVAVSINPRWRGYTKPVRVAWDSLHDRSAAVAAVAAGVDPELTGLTAAPASA